MGFSKYLGYGISTLALYFLNKRSSSKNERSTGEADALKVSSTDTKIGNPIPAIMGRCLIKSPIISYFGDFRSEIYTEEYAAHANINAAPLIMSILAYILQRATGHVVSIKNAGPMTINAPVEGKAFTKDGEAPVVGKVTELTILNYNDITPPSIDLPSSASGKVPKPKDKSSSHPIATKDDATGPLLYSIITWLLGFLINKRNLKTTIQKGFKYFLGYQFLVCWSGDNIRIRHIWMKENSCWEGDVSKSAQNGQPYEININDYNLFGGPDEQGGFDGNMHIYLGGNNQGTDTWMLNQMNKDSVQEDLRGLTPAYRPFVSIVVPTAYIGKQSTIPETWIEMQNIPNRLGLGAVGEDANPAEALFELHVNNDWGLGESEELIDKESLKKIGKTLSDEGVGISIQLSSKTEARDLINNILTHINAYKFMDTATGKMSFKLVRDDYDPATAFLLDVSNCSKVEFTRPDWHETVGRVNVSYTDRENNYEEASIPAVDPANIEINNTITEKSYQYTYFTTSKLALWAAKRELTEQAYPLANVEITANRTAYAVRIGDVVRLNWKPYGIKNMLIRITKVDLGDLETGQIKITGMEDIWGLNKTDFDFSGSTEWQPEEYYPTGVQAFKYIEMPWELSNSLDSYVSALAAKPDNKTQYWTVWRQPAGENFATTTTKSKWTAAGRLVYDMGEFDNVEDITGIEIAEIYGIGDMPSQALADIAKAREGGGIIIIDDEIIAYSTLLQNGHWYIKGLIRGTFDTVPKAHYGQANVFFIRSDRYANVTTGGPVCEAGAHTDESYNITTSIGQNKEEFDVLKVRELKTVQRSEAPSPPGKIRISDHNYTDKYHSDNVTGNLNLSFVERNKFMSFGCVSQDDDIEYWSKQNFKAENGTDYLIKVTVAGKTIEKACTQSPFIYTYEDRCNDFSNLTDDTYIALYARNNKLLSYQPQERHFSWTIPTMVDGNFNQQAATDKMKDWELSDRITMPKGNYSSEQQILYSDMPIILLGTSANKNDAGAILIHDGSYIIPNGDILIPTGVGTYETYTMAAGYTFISYFIETATGGKKIYEWDGYTIIERTQ